MAMDIRGRIGTVIGAARSGIAAANVIVALGAKAQVSEFKPREAVEKDLAGLASTDIAVECGGHTREMIQKSDFIVLSPGVRGDIPPVLWAKANGIEVMGEIEFAYRLCKAPIIAVTGSNGKTTTVTLITQILKKAGKNAVLCGNIGSPFSKHVLSLSGSDIVVLELSSFQLESTSTFKPKVAVWLNFSQNHLDRHKDLEEYFQAKCMIAARQGPGDVCVLNAADPKLVNYSVALKSRVVFFNQPGDYPDLNPNQQAALRAVSVFGIGEEVCREVFKEFKGVEHRMEFVRSLRGVDYINDSKSTTPEAGGWALRLSLKPLVLICGGSDKHLDFSPLKSLVHDKVKHMLVIGQTKKQLAETFRDVTDVREFLTLPEALASAKVLAREGDCVLLSPMCASFDMFNDYEHRGKVFKSLVEELR